MQRLGPPHWPNYPPGRAYGDLYDRDRSAGLARRPARRPPDRGRSRPLGITVDCLPLADVPVPGADSVIGDRAYGTTPAQVAAIAAAVAEGLGGRRRAAGAQAHSRPRPRDRRQPRQPAGRRRRPRHARSDRFRRVSPAAQAAAGDDRACCVHRDRPGRAGHHFGHDDARGDSRIHRVRRPADERRRVDGGPVRVRLASARGCARGRLRRRASLQRQARRDARGRGRMRRRSPARRSARADAALARPPPACTVRSATARRRIRPLLAAVGPCAASSGKSA